MLGWIYFVHFLFGNGLMGYIWVAPRFFCFHVMQVQYTQEVVSTFKVKVVATDAIIFQLKFQIQRTALA